MKKTLEMTVQVVHSVYSEITDDGQIKKSEYFTYYN